MSRCLGPSLVAETEAFLGEGLKMPAEGTMAEEDVLTATSCR